MGALCIGVVLVVGLLVLIPNLGAVDAAEAQGGTGPESGQIGLASNALECLAVGNDVPGKASGTVRLAWQGRIEQARLILGVSGAGAAHTIKVNGRSVAQAPIHPGGQPCGGDEFFYLEIPPEVLVQGANQIEITNDAWPDDSWTASQVRLEVIGHFTALRTTSIAGSAAISYTCWFTNPYDGSSQAARVVDYSGGAPKPLAIFVHGRSSSMYEGEETLGEAIGEKGWLLASPELHGSWTGEPQPDPPGKYAYASLESQYDVIGTVNYMLSHYSVITDQIYLVGYSMGGQIATVTAAKFPHVFAVVFDNKGPTDMGQWYYENTSYHQRWMRRECHIDQVEQDPTQNPFCYQRRSGMHFASNYIHVPISITHSISDVLVPIYHSRNLRDAINGYGPDRPVVVVEDSVVGPTCPPDYHCYEPDPMAVLNFLGLLTLNNDPTQVYIATDESKSVYWMNLVQTGGDHWSQVEAAYHPVSATVTALISDTQPLTVAFNLGSTNLSSTSVSEKLKQPGMGLAAMTYLVAGGGNYRLENYVSGYVTAALATTGQFWLTISAIEAELSADPVMVSGWQTATSIITAVVKDRLSNPIPDGTTIQFFTSMGAFPNGSSAYTASVMDGQVTTTLILPPGAGLAEIVASVGSITDSTSVDVIRPAIDVLVTPSQSTVYSGQAVTYTYRIANTGDITLTDVILVDDNGTPGASGDDLTVCANVVLAAGATTSYSRSITLTQTTTRTVTVTGQDPLGTNIVDKDSATVVVQSDEFPVSIYLPVVIRAE
jgi:esterase/lipase